jgi:hypothetical protein
MILNVRLVENVCQIISQSLICVRETLMNKMFQRLLLSVLALSAAQVRAHTNQTFLLPRSTGVDVAMQSTSFHSLTGHKGHNRFGGSIAATGFYQGSNNGSDLAKYFLVGNKSSVVLGQFNAALVALPTGQLAAPAANVDLPLQYIIHTHAGVDARAKLSLDPERTVWGVRFDYHQDLSKILNGLYLAANLPVANVETNVKGKVSEEVAAGVYSAGTLASYLAGNYKLEGGRDNQVALTHAKAGGKQSETGVADIDVQLGYKLLNKKDMHVALALGVTIPTGNEATGAYLFQPLVGNGKHWALGGDLCAGARVWGEHDHNIGINLVAKYRYLFESSEKRTLGLKYAGESVPAGQYALLVKAGRAANDGLIPAANVLTQNVNVTPGSQLDSMLSVTYNNGGLSADLGYNLYYREAESVKRKDATWSDTQYAIANINFDTTAAGPAALDAAGVGYAAGGAAGYAAPIKATDLNTSACATPAQTTHGVVAGLGYTFREWETPLMLGLGGKYEFAGDNAAVEQWGVWLKAGLAF